MKNRLLLAVALLVMLSAQGQVPQFSGNDFDGWVYSNPAIPLTQSNILSNRIVLYTTSKGLPLTLTSPLFTCGAGQTIDMTVTWITDQWQTSGFDKNKVALTAALLDETGISVDSVTCALDEVSRTNIVNLSIVVPAGMHQAKLRFASWLADVNSNGAVRQIDVSSSLVGDVNQDGEVTVADVNAVLDVILGAGDPDLCRRADVNRDGEVSVADVNRVVDIIIQ